MFTPSLRLPRCPLLPLSPLPSSPLPHAHTPTLSSASGRRRRKKKKNLCRTFVVMQYLCTSLSRVVSEKAKLYVCLFFLFFLNTGTLPCFPAASFAGQRSSKLIVPVCVWPGMNRVTAPNCHPLVESSSLTLPAFIRKEKRRPLFFFHCKACGVSSAVAVTRADAGDQNVQGKKHSERTFDSDLRALISRLVVAFTCRSGDFDPRNHKNSILAATCFFFLLL